MLDKIKSKFSWFVLGIIFILGLFSRLNLINKSTFWYDEAFSGILIKQDIGSVLKIIYEDRVHPPVYYFLLKIWSVIFGNTDTTLRMFSVVFGMALIVAAFILLKKMFNTRAALVGAGLFALSPYFILYSLEARSYIVLGLEALVAIFIFVKLYKKDFKNFSELIRLKEVKQLATITILILLTHYLGLVLIGTMCILLFIKLYPRLEKYIWSAFVIILVLILARGAINGGDYRIYPKEATHTKWLEDAQPLTIAEMLYSFLFGVDSQGIAKQNVFKLSFIKDLNTVFIVLITLSIVLSMHLINTKKVKLSVISKLFLLNLLVTTILSLFGVNILIPRYVMYLAIVFIVWIASLVSQINVRGYFITAGVYVILLTQVVWVSSNKYFDNLAQIKEEAVNGRVVVKSPFEYLVLKYYLNDNRNLYFLDSSQWNMRQGAWLFFDKKQIIDRLIEDDKVI